MTELDCVIKKNFLGNCVSKEHMHYNCITCITIDSVIKIKKKKKNYPQVYLEESKDKIRKIQISRFIKTELDSDSETDAKLESDSDSE